MAIERRDWRATFSSFPSWLCPTCQRGNLAIRQDTEHHVETGPSSDNRQYGNWDVEDIVERFVALMVCSNASCRELVAISGDAGHHQVFDDHRMEMDYERFFRPKFINPALPLFPIPKRCPEAVAEELRKASALYWSDTGSCANRLRSAVEALLTEQKVVRYTTDKNGKRVPLTLHSRIDKFRAKDAHSAEMLLAIKWLGNAGSHANLDALSADNVLDGFDLFEHVVERIYANRDKAMKRLATKITSRKGKPAKAKKRSLS